VIEDIDRIRLQHLKENMKQDLKLLKEYEGELRFETDPRRLGDIRRNIQRQHESVRQYRQEYEKLQKIVTPAQVQNISDLLQQQEAKLDEVNKLLPPIWNVSHIRNTHFTGRDDILSELRASLTSGEPAGWKQAVTGMGGVGKTQIALEYIYRHMAEYQIIWWIRSEELATMAADYASLAKPLDLSEKDSADQLEIVRAVKSWLEHNSSWLLIFDNAQDTNEMGDYLPRAGGGHIIITSRNPKWSKIAKVLHAKVFDRTESIDFLCRRTEQDDKEAADMLAEELGDLPLALEQAGAYIEETTMSLAAYCELFQSRRQELWGEESPPMGYPKAVGATWSLAMEQVGEESPEAAYLLNLCSYLAPDDIPVELLREGKEHLPEPLASVMADQLIMNRAVRGLSRYSLIESKDETLSVHRLVQAVVRDRLDEDDEKECAEIALNLVNEVFPNKSSDVRTWPLCSLLMPHALVAAAHAETLEVAPGETDYILNQIGTYLGGRADFKEAKVLFTRALHLAEQVYGPDHPDVAIDVSNLGSVLQDLGDLQGAKKNYERALAIGEAVCGPDHPTVATLVNNLGDVLQDLGDLQGAKKNFERALAIDESSYGPDHPTVAIRVNNLGRVLQDLGDLKGAKKNLERALAIHESAYGPDHPTVAIGVNNLGLVLKALGDLQGAKKNFERALAIHESAYSPDHPAVAIGVNNLGRVLQDLGDLQGAKKNFERAPAIDEAVYGPDHPDVAIDVSNLGGVLQDLGDMQGAKENFERALAIGEAAYGPDHPAVAIRVGNLGGVLKALGDLQGAKKNYERALAIDEAAYGPDHPDVAIDVGNLGGVLQDLEDLQGAKKNYERTLAIFTKFLGDDHPNTVTVRNNIENLESQLES
jgi:tetratricopeptide (TPR) repeat protein